MCAKLFSSEYLDPAQQAQIRHERTRLLWWAEWPTWILIGVIYGGWLGTLLVWDALGSPIATCLMIWWCT